MWVNVKTISMGQAIDNYIHKNGKQIVKRKKRKFNDLLLDDMDLIDFVNDRQ